jgi:hypothetical protein
LKKLSARRKKPSLGRRAPFAMRRYSCSSEWDWRVPKRKFLVPPSGLKPHATAIASSSVDLPEHFEMPHRRQRKRISVEGGHLGALELYVDRVLLRDHVVSAATAR